MKITDVRVESFRWPRAKPISNGKHTYTHSGVGLVFIDTDEGTTGIGLGGNKGGVVGATIESMKQHLIGEDPINVERLWHKMWVPKLTGRRGMTTRGISAIANGLILEFYPKRMDPMCGKVYNETLSLNDDGTVSPPEVPGIGIEPRYETLEPYRVN